VNNKTKLPERNQAMKRLFIFIFLLIIASSLLYFAQNPLSLETVQTHKDATQQLYMTHPLMFSIGFILIYTVSTALSLPIATLLSLLAGFIFGNIIGTFYVVFSATLGATFVFLLAKMAVGEFLKKKATYLYKKVEKPFNKNPVSYLLFMRLVPLFPFALVNIVPALFNVKNITYIWVTFVGIIPGAFVYVNVGTSLAQVSTLSDIFSPQLIIAFTLLGCFSLVPILIRKYRGTKITGAQ
jgi:uncharacterized membrane protein YdjX (TVP38/TMEM64 family)